MTPAIFFDRDGTLMQDVHYCRDPRDVEVFPGVANALQRARSAGYRIVLVTNQSGIGRGLYTVADYHRVHAELERQLGGPASLDAAYFSPEAPDIPSEFRKPAPGMLLSAARDLAIDLAASWMVGDKQIDVLAGKAAGTSTILVRTGYGQQHESTTTADLVADDAVSATEYILSHTSRR